MDDLAAEKRIVTYVDNTADSLAAWASTEHQRLYQCIRDLKETITGRIEILESENAALQREVTTLRHRIAEAPTQEAAMSFSTRSFSLLAQRSYRVSSSAVPI